MFPRLLSLLLLNLTACGFLLGQEAAVGDLVSELSAEAFHDRNQAHVRLLAHARADFLANEDTLLDALFTSTDPEASRRLKEIVEEASVFHYLQRTNRGFIGITLTKDSFFDAESNKVHAIRVTRVYTNTPGERAGLVIDDMILAADGQRVEDWVTTQVFIDHIQSKRPGDQIELHVPREGGIKRLSLELAPRPEAIKTATRTSIYSTQPSSKEWYASWIRAKRRIWQKKRTFAKESP